MRWRDIRHAFWDRVVWCAYQFHEWALAKYRDAQMVYYKDPEIAEEKE